MSSDTIAVGVFSIVGSLLGVAIGLFGERWLRSRGPLYCTPCNWSGLQANADDGRGSWTVTPLESAADATSAEYTVDLDLFNGKDITAGLWDLRVVLECNGGELISEPQDRATATEVARQMNYDNIGFTNIPPHQGIRVQLRGSFQQKGAVTPTSWCRVRVEADRLVRGPLELRTYKKTIAERS